MNDERNHSNESTSGKAAWETPTIEEIDYAQTEASYIPGTADAAIYTV
jgi:hypothetical protein